MKNITEEAKGMKYIQNIWMLAVLGWVLVGCGGKTETVAEDKKTFVLSDTMMAKIETAEAEVEPVMGRLRLNGKVEANEDKLVEIFPLVGGNVAEVNVELGQFVEKGTILAVIRSGEVADYERELTDAESDVAVAEKNLRITQDLYDSKLTGDKDLLAVKKELDKAKAELKRIQEIFHIYGITNNAEYVVRSPISGFIIEKNITRDMQLRSDNSGNIFTVAQITDVYVTANVYETDISKIKEGMMTKINVLAYPDRLFEGRIDRIFTVLDPATQTMKVRIKLPNADFALKPEMNATISVEYNDGDQRMVSVPSSAVIFDKNKNFVMIFKDKYNIETRVVEIYRQNGDVAYVSSGLKSGEKVVSKNQLFLYDALND